MVHQAQSGLLHRLDRGAGQYIVELGKEQIPPSLGQPLLGIVQYGLKRRGRCHLLNRIERVLQRTVLLLDADLRGIAADTPRIDVQLVAR
jgi:hypothetical protein